ncbi:MAG: hypothetical protein R3250_06570 [Melioribacteraceae bacterium]|nr:hypothetical protein [Melioribacteraceae bacterium]
MNKCIFVFITLCILCISYKTNATNHYPGSALKVSNPNQLVLISFESEEYKYGSGISALNFVKDCVMTIKGYIDLEGIGTIPISFTATAETCEKAGQELREAVIAFKLRIYK